MQFIQKIKPVFSIIIFTILIFNCDNNPTEPDNKDISITVKVVDSDGLPITDVSIHFIYTNWFNFANNKYYKVFSTQDDSSVAVDSVITPSNKLYQNYPNPFNPMTCIPFSLAKESSVSLIVYDWPNYNQICTLINQKCSAGYYEVVWNGKNTEDEIMGNGLYPYKLKTDDFEEEKIMCIQHLSMEVLESSNSNYKTDNNGEVEIDYSDIPIGKIIYETSEMGPAIINSFTITDSIYIALTKPNYNPIVERVKIDTTTSISFDFILEKK